MSEILSSSDIDAIKAYNKEIDNCVTSQTAFNRTMLDASEDAQNVVAAANGNKVALDGLTKSSKAAELGMKALAMAGNMLLMWGISEAINLIYSCATASDRLRESANKLGSEFSKTSSDISSYKEKITELKAIINDSNSSYQDNYNARENLLSIQDELIEKYGKEADTIKLITDAVNDSVEALDTLTNSEWEIIKAKYTSDPDRAWYQKAGDWLSNTFVKDVKNNFDAMVKDMEDTSVAFTIEPEYDNEAYINFSKKLEEEFNATKYVSGAGDKFYLTGNLNDLKDELVQIKSLAEDLGFSDNLTGLTSEIARVQSVYDDYEEIYNQYILYDKILKSENGYEEYYKQASNAYKEFREAQKSGDEKSIEDAKQNYVELIQQITSSDGMEKGIIDFFNNMYPELKAEVGKWEFQVNFKAALDDNENDLENQIKDALSNFGTIEDLTRYNAKTANEEQINAKNFLDGIASQYNMSDEDFYNTLLEMNLISSQAKIDLADKITASYAKQEEQTRQAVVNAAKQNLEDEYKKIDDYGLSEYADYIKSGNFQTKFGNVDMNNRTIIQYDEQYLKDHADILKSWVEEYDKITGEPIYTKYNEVADAIANGEQLIDTVWGQSDRFGEDINETGWEIAFTPILPDGTFLSKDTVYDYINSILQDAYANDGKVTADELKEFDAQGRQIGNTFVKGILAGIDDSENYDDNGNKADVIGRIMHFVGKFGAINLGTEAVGNASKFKKKRISNEIQSWIDNLSESDAQLANSTEFENAINKRKSVLHGAELSAQDYADALEYVKNAESGISNENHLSFTEAISKVEDLSDGLDQLDKIYADVLNKEDFDWSSILNNDSFKNAFEECGDAYSDFIKTVSNSPDDIDACQEAFNNLASAYIENSGALNNLTEENKQATITMLEQMGIANAEEVVTATLAHNKEELTLQNVLLANSTMDLSTVTAEEIQRLLDEGVVTEDVAKQLASYAVEKQYTNDNVIKTEADCNNLIALMKTAEGTTTAVAKLEKLKARLYDEKTGAAKVISNEERKNVENAINAIAAEFNAKVSETIKVPQMTYNGGSASKKALDDINKASKSAEKTADDLYNDLKSQIEAYLDFMEKSLDAGRIDYDTYCRDVKKYLDDLYNSGKLKAADYFDYVERSLTKQKEIYDKVLSAITDRLDEEIDKWQEKINSLEDTNNKLNDNLSNMDSALDAIDKVYDKEIDRIQAIIDGLKDANDERDRTLALEKAKYELEKAYNNRVKKLYVEGRGYIYDVDYDAIKDAQQTYDNAELDLKTAELEKQISELQKFKDMWDNVKNAYQDGVDDMNATALLGSEYQKLILNNNILDIENFKNQYVGIQQQINSNEELIKSYEEKKNYYDKLKSEWSALSDEYENTQNDLLAKQVLGANWENDVLNGRLSTMDNFRTQYISVQQALADAQWQSANEQIKALQALADAAWVSANEQINAAKEAQKAASGSTGSAGSVGSAYNVPGMISAGAPTSVINKITGSKSNTSAAATADQRKNNPNTIMSKEQEITIKKNEAQQKKLANNIRAYASGGVVKVNPNDVFFKDTAKQIGEDTLAFVKDGERVLTPVQNKWWEKWTDSIPQMFSLLDNIPHDAFTGMNDLVRNLSENNVSKTVSNNQPVTISIGDIVLQGVQNPEQLADAIIKYMPGTMKQKLSKSGR